MAYCRRFIINCRHSKANRHLTTLSTQELDHALSFCENLVQQISYVQELKDLMEQQEIATTSSIKTLHPFIDKEGLLRVGGRLQQSLLPYQAMHQMILPPNHHFTNLVVSAEHIRLHHAGPQLLTASLRERYWIPGIEGLSGQLSTNVSLAIHSRHKLHHNSWVSFHQPEYNHPDHFTLWSGLCWPNITQNGNTS